MLSKRNPSTPLSHRPMYTFFSWMLLSCLESQPTTIITEEETEQVEIRTDITRPERIKARHILIAHKNAFSARSNLRRTRAEAKELAQDLYKQLQQNADFVELSKKYGNDPSAGQGGKLGVFGPNQMMKNFSTLAFQLKENEMGICETIFGYHIVQRLPLEEIVLRQLVIQWKDAYASKATRTEEEADILATDVYQLLQDGAEPIALIKKYSDGSMGSRGGLVGFVEKEKVGPKLKEAAFALQVGEHTPLLKSHLGYHILFREE